MRLIEQIVRHHQIVARQPLALALVRPRRVEGIGHDRVRRRLFRIAHPDPDKIVPLRDREAADLRFRGNVRLVRNLHAAARPVEHQSMIFAADVVADHLAERERHPAMAAAIFQRHELPVLRPIEHHGLVQERARDRL
ncbi:MAG: hypothetical protein WBW74_02250 [Xanthobacteraceae bacterium]